MHKERAITHILDQKKTFLINLKPNTEFISKIAHDLSFIEKTDFLDALKSNPSQFNGKTIPLFEDAETGFIILKNDATQIILLKESHHFENIKDYLLNRFEHLTIG